MQYLDQVVCGDCLELMRDIPDGSIDMILCDLPYGVTARNWWDIVIDPKKLWDQYRRVAKPNAAIVLTATQPFASLLVSSNPRMFRYDWVWEKNKTTGFLNAKKMPLRKHELVLVFYEKLPTYNPQKTTGHKPVNSFTKHTSDGTNYGSTQQGISGGGQTDRYPTSVLRFSVVNNDDPDKVHPTQKPIDLFEYLVRTYTNPGEVVLDNCCGSGTTAVACKRSGRHFVCMDIDPGYCESAKQRLVGG